MASTVVAVTPGQIIPQSDWEELSHQHGDVAGKPTLRAATKAEMTAAGLAQDEDPAFEQRPIYRYAFPDGSYVEARTAPNGQDYQIVDYKPSARFTAQHPASGTAAGGTNTYIGINPRTGKPSEVTEYPDGRPPTYDDTKVPASQATQGQTTTVEGTQRPDGTWDNTQPREVTRGANGQLISSKPLEGEARTRWEAQYGPGQTGEGREAVPNRPGWTAITRTKVERGNTTKTTVYVGPDGQEVASLPAQTKSSREPLAGYPGYSTVTTDTNGIAETHVEKDDAPGVHVPSPAVKPGTIAAGKGPNGEDMQAVPDPEHPGQVKYVPVPGSTGKNTFVPEPAGMPPRSTDPGSITTDLEAYSKALGQKVHSGELTNEQASQLMAQRYQLAGSQVAENTAGINATNAVQTGQITQRGQDIDEVASRRTAANTVYDNVFNQFAAAARAGYGDYNDDVAGKAFMQALGLAQQNAEKWGGMQQVGREDPSLIKFSHDGKGGVKIEIPHTPNAIGAGQVGAVGAPGGDAQPDQQAAPAALPPPIFAPQPPADAPAPYNPPTVDGGNDPTRPVGQVPDYLRVAQNQPIQWDPRGTIAQLEADPRVSKDVIQQALAELQRAA